MSEWKSDLFKLHFFPKDYCVHDLYSISYIHMLVDAWGCQGEFSADEASVNVMVVNYINFIVIFFVQCTRYKVEMCLNFLWSVVLCSRKDFFFLCTHCLLTFMIDNKDTRVFNPCSSIRGHMEQLFSSLENPLLCITQGKY